MAKVFSAAKTRSNRPGWSITFRHPLRTDTQGRIGLKVRRGLGTEDAVVADQMVDQMNVLLSDPTWWSATRRMEAETRFFPVIVRAFFDDLQVGSLESVSLREQHLPMPSKEDGYARVLFVGTTGAGKTTLLRQLIGSDPDVDRFPSTAPAKTTIADIEVIAGGNDYAAIVTFCTEFQVQANVEECVMDAALAAHNKQSEPRVADRFLNHRDQKFRLSYILGNWSAGPHADPYDDSDHSDDDDDDDLPTAALADDEVISDFDRKKNREVLEGVVARIRQLASQVSAEISLTLGVNDSNITKDDLEAYLELLGEEFEKELYSKEEFHNLVQDVMDLIKERFDLLEAGTLTYAASGWPQSWAVSETDRTRFITSIRWFSSNHWPQFGRLLTPIVDGMRLKGPLYPEFCKGKPKLVLIDGQGIGHTPDEATSLTTHITNRFADVEVVLLVDNAQQPMQAAPLSVLKALAISGYESKLAIAFTHFDQIKGQNLPTMADRKAHVMASVMSALASLQSTVGPRIVRGLERGIDGRCFMLSATQKKLKGLGPKGSAYLTNQLNSLIGYFEDAASRTDILHSETALMYDPMGISFAVQNGAASFNRAWRARLGLGVHQYIRKEHWTRIKAMNKRFAGGLGVEYDTLRPLADLQTSMLEAISRYLDAPVSEPDGDGEQRGATRARQIVAARLNATLRQRLVSDQMSSWRAAYDDRGAGSAGRRANKIAVICSTAAPVPEEVMKINTKAFVKEISAIVVSAVVAVGGRINYGDESEE